MTERDNTLAQLQANKGRKTLPGSAFAHSSPAPVL